MCIGTGMGAAGVFEAENKQCGAKEKIFLSLLVIVKYNERSSTKFPNFVLLLPKQNFKLPSNYVGQLL